GCRCPRRRCASWPTRPPRSGSSGCARADRDPRRRGVPSQGAPGGNNAPMLRLRTPWIVLLLAAALVPLTGCGDDDDGGGGGAPESSTTASSPTEGTATTTSISTTTDGDGDTLHIVVTNDDGIGAEGIDLLTQALVELDGVEVTIVAPAENQSGKGDTTTGGELVGEPATTASGLEGIAVDGTPADTMVWAFEQGGLASLGFEDDPDLVIS